MQVDVRVLFDDYNYWREKTAYLQKLKQTKPFMRPMKATKERLALFAQMQAWCAGNRIMPRQWLYSLFAMRRWQYAPKLEHGHLCSENMLNRFRTFSDYKAYNQRLLETDQATKLLNPVTYDPNLHISHTAEEAKQHYLRVGDLKTCMGMMDTETFGYHPKSKACSGCSARDECAQKLGDRVNFDIAALRRGEITSEQAYMIALARINGYGN